MSAFSGCTSCCTKKLLYYAITIYVFWLAFAIHRVSTELVDWRNPERGWRELKFWMMFPLSPWMSHAGLASFSLDHNDLTENEEQVNVSYFSDPVEALEGMKVASDNKDRIVVWKGFIEDNGYLKKYQDFESFQKLVNLNDSYSFLDKYSNEKKIRVQLKDALPRLKKDKDLYMGFNYEFLGNNQNLLADFKKALGHYGEDFLHRMHINNCIQHSFLYWGNRYSSAAHQAGVSGFVIQISNTKVWRFISPKYTPYMKPLCCYEGGSMLSGHSYLRNSTNIPYVDVVVEAGDLVYFPEYYWHEVHNVHPDEFGCIIGFRPLQDIVNPLPWIIPQHAKLNMFGQKLMQGSWMFHKFLTHMNIPLYTRSKHKGGVDLRKDELWDLIREVYPEWSMDKWMHPQKADDMMGPYYSKEFLEAEMKRAGNHDE